MSRFIDTEQLKHDLNNSVYYGTDAWDAFCNMIDKCDSVDAVQVVRCVECKHRDAEIGFCKGRGWPMQLVPEDGFCDKGERSEDE